MIRRLLQARLRLIDAVAIAAVAVLGLKLVAFMTAPPKPDAAIKASGVVTAEDQLPSFGRVFAQARTNFVPPDVVMTGAVPPKEEAAKEAAAPPQDDKSQPPASRPTERAPRAASPSERALLERLGERRGELQQRNRDLELRERLLENAEKKLEARINELKGLEAKAEEAAKSGSPEAGLRNLVTMYEAMKPKDAARVFDRLSHDVLVPVVLQMNPRKMAEVLAVMAPEAAEKLTVALAARARIAGAETRSATAPPNPLPPNELPAIEPPAARPAR
jgi:flagellar motility protein MotE (MotC chaperone)